MAELNKIDALWDDNPVDITAEANFIWSIANKFGTSVNTIRMVNNLNSDVLSIGQILICYIMGII